MNAQADKPESPPRIQPENRSWAGGTRYATASSGFQVQRTRAWPRSLVLALSVLVAAGLVVLFLFDPGGHGFYPGCLFKRISGYDCPGCGGLRALHQLLHGNVWQAIQLNALFVLALPLLVAWAVWQWKQPAGGRASTRSVILWAWGALALLVLFGLARNLPWWPFGLTPQ